MHLRPHLTSLTALVLFSCTSADTSAPTLTSDSPTEAALTSANAAPIAASAQSNFCLDITQNSSANGTRVGLYTCNGTDAQKWTFDNGLIRASNNRCLNVIDGAQGNNVRLQIWSCSSSDRNMIFALKGNTIRWPVNNKCLDVVDGRFADGTAVQLYDCFDNSSNQSWTLSPLQASGGVSAGGGGSQNPQSGTLDGFVSQAKQIPWNLWTHQNQVQGLVNNEQEAYITDGSTISFEGSTLVITAYSAGNGYGWKSGKLLAPVLANRRGYIEASINTPSAQGTWPAFWLMPNNNSPTWPQGGEIDIMEQVNGLNQQNVSTHFGPSPSQTTDTHVQMDVPNMSGQYHRYGLAWDSSHCAFYVDGRKVPGGVVYFPGNSPFADALPNYTPILNLAMGGMWPGYAADSIGVQQMRVKYVVQSTETPNDF